jgi:DinB superfamily
MHAKDFIATSIGRQRWIADAVMQDLTEEQLNWSPPGLANKIATILIHVTGTDGRFINLRALGKPTIWESGNWSEQLGLSQPPGGGGGSWEDANASNFSLDAVRGYITAVRASVDDYVAALTDEELARTVQSIGGEQPISAVLALLIVHAAGHYGEVAALKGTQGAKGLPF